VQVTGVETGFMGSRQIVASRDLSGEFTLGPSSPVGRGGRLILHSKEDKMLIKKHSRLLFRNEAY